MNYSMNSNKDRMPKTSGFLIRRIALLHNGQRLLGEIGDQTEFDTGHVLLAKTKRVTSSMFFRRLFVSGRDFLSYNFIHNATFRRDVETT